MLKNVISISIRHLFRYKLLSLINLAGLSAGLATSFVILLYVLDGYEYDTHHEKRDRIYRVIAENIGFDTKSPDVPYIFVPTVLDEIPEIEGASRITSIRAQIKEDKSIKSIPNFKCVDQSLLDIFTIKFIQGNKLNALQDPYSVILSESTAKEYLSDNIQIGQFISIVSDGEEYNLKVTGIFQDFPDQSTFKANFISPIDVAKKGIERRWVRSSPNPCESWNIQTVQSYVLLDEIADESAVRVKLKKFGKNYSHENRSLDYSLQPISEIYFHSSHLVNNRTPQGNINYIYVFSSVAVLILFMVLANYALLSTAQSSVRFKEIGIRKALGARRANIVFQFMAESILLSVIAIPFAIILSEIILPYLNEYLESDLIFNYFDNLPYLMGIFIITIIIGLLSGIYSSFYLSKFQPIKIVSLDILYSKSLLRKALTVFQLVIFVSLITATTTIYRQMQYTKDIDMGFNKEQLVIIDLGRNSTYTKYSALKNKLLSFPNIVIVSAAVEIPPCASRTIMRIPKSDDPTQFVNIEGLSVDYDFIETLDLNIVQGRNFSRDFNTDSESAIIFNETAIHLLGIKNIHEYDGNLIGVVNDFNIHSLHEKIPPVRIRLTDNYLREMVIRISPSSITETIKFIKQKWTDIFPDQVFTFYFFDERVENLYKSEINFGKIIKRFSILAVLIATLGLFSLSLFIAERRAKEVSIRKVFGASLQNIFSILSKQFIFLVFLSLFFSIPISWYFMDMWLQNFAYRIELNLSTFILSGLGALLITFATISFQLIKVGLTNPIETLRWE